MPASTTVDEPLDITLPGAESAERLRVEARTEDAAGNAWASHAAFDSADETVHLPDASPVDGTYDEPAGMGLFWSMKPENEGVRVYDRRQPVQTVELSVRPDRADAEPIASTTVERRLVAQNSTVREVEDPVVGTLVESPTEGPAPGVVLFHGSGGGRSTTKARVLASHGFTVLALQYFSPDYDQLPDALVEVPIEYAERAVDWLRNHESVSDAPVGLGGVSRGGELALYVGSRHDAVGTVVNWMGAGLLFNAVILTDSGRISPETPDTSAWSLDGEPLPHPSLPEYNQGIRMAQQYELWLDETPDSVIDGAEIPLDELSGPVLLVSAGDDGVWPSRYLLNRTESRFDEVEYQHQFEHLTYDNAGHSISVPYLPTWPNRPASPYGGTRAGTAAAEAESWARAVEYFQQGAEQ